jgi:hypothetical protein
MATDIAYRPYAAALEHPPHSHSLGETSETDGTFPVLANELTTVSRVDKNE